MKLSLDQWQEKLLPLMSLMLIGLTAVFFAVGIIQINSFYGLIERAPALDVYTLTKDESGNPLPKGSAGLEYVQWRTISILEGHNLKQRYHQANVFIMSRIWTRFFGFITGMTLALVGAAFVLGKLTEAASRLDLNNAPLKVSLITASPGLVLAALGTVLMVTAMVATSNIYVNDKPVYIELWRSIETPPGRPATWASDIFKPEEAREKALDALKQSGTQ
jgi:hypothetical protein